ncbi:MAG: DASS family sodium-coupled anion symporter [Bryobacteraceae bacterium]|jgi:DASS family divalent anion:Na+ symporter
MRTGGRWLAVLIPGLVLYFIPVLGLNPVQAHLLAIFVATIVALVAQPVPMGVSVLIALTLLDFTGTLAPGKIFSGFSNVTVWLIFTAFLFARAVTGTGFGARVGYLFVSRFGRSSLSLGYSVAASDLVLAPFVPSDTARGGGIVFPIARSIAAEFGSEPGPTAGRMGTFLMLSSFHTTYTASAMFLTSMAANPLIADFARRIGHLELTWVRWFSGSVVPGFLTLAIVPWVIHKLFPPEIRDMAPARELARRELERMGPMRRPEKSLLVVIVGVMAGWVTSPWHSIPNTFVALAGVCALLLLRVLTWEELLGEKRAWDALVWFAAMLMMSDQLNETGVIKIFSARLFSHLAGWPWILSLVVLVAAYNYIHYGFASMTAQVTALYPGFLAAALAAGVPPLLAALPLGYFSSLNAAMTHYGTGSAPVFFAGGYVKQAAWWRIGLVISLVNMAIWMGVGMWWWKLIGLW